MLGRFISTEPQDDSNSFFLNLTYNYFVLYINDSVNQYIYITILREDNVILLFIGNYQQPNHC